MKIHEFADKHLKEYQVKGEEIVPVYCPYCHGGKYGKDKYTFALNEDNGTYNCKRGSCAVAGTFNQLLKDFGEKSADFEIRKPRQKSYQKPTTQTKPASSKVEQYMAKRMISKSTWEARGILESEGNIAFPYYENGEVVLMKFRKPQKHDGKGPKAWREPGGKSVFWGMDDCTPEKPLVIVEGEFDALALNEAGVTNVVSVPSGAEDLDCIDNCWDWLDQFKQIHIWPDNDEPGQAMMRKMVSRLGAWRCYVIESDYKDANECLFYEGAEGVKKACRNAREVPISGLIRLAEVESFDYSQVERVPSSIDAVNEIVGGYMAGMVTIWTGKNSSGKSTFLGQEMLNAIDNNYRVCAYSGELPAPIFRYWIDLQAAGPVAIEAKYDSLKNKEIFKPDPTAIEVIRSWYYDAFFLYDRLGAADEDSLLEVFEYAAKRYDCRVFLVDNLTSMVTSATESNYYRKQSQFVEKIVDFAKLYNAHVHIVAHPRKTEGRLGKNDVMGSGDITNLVDNVISIHRLNDDEKNEMKAEKGVKCENFADIFKNRMDGEQEKTVALDFCHKTKRFWQLNNHLGRDFVFGWMSGKKV